MSEEMAVLIFGPIVLLAIFFLSGFFETWIVKKCTWCGAGGKMTAISHHGAIGLGQGFRGPLQRVSWGVIHDNIVCEKCFDRWCWDESARGLPDSVKKLLPPRP